MRVLFIGNSYTYFNDLPDLLTRIAAADGLEITTESVVEGGMTLLGHLRSGEAIRRIRSGGWDVVVLQEQSTRPIDAPGLMDVAAQELAREIDLIGARTALYLTWARREHPDDQAILNAAYHQCSRATGATVVPVGPCWQRALGENPSAELYHEDGSHPAPMGTYLAACAFYAALTGRNPEGTPVWEVRAGDGEAYVPLELPAEDASFLQQVARAAVSTTDLCTSPEAQRVEWSVNLDVEAQLLRELPLLRGLSPHDADELLSRARRLRIPAGGRICSEGTRGDTAYIVLDGEVQMQMSGGYDEVFEPWLMGIVQAVDVRSLLGEPCSYTLTAVTDVTALALRSNELEVLAIERPALAAALKRNVASE